MLLRLDARIRFHIFTLMYRIRRYDNFLCENIITSLYFSTILEMKIDYMANLLQKLDFLNQIQKAVIGFRRVRAFCNFNTFPSITLVIAHF